MLAYSEVWIREALLSAAVKVARPRVERVERNVISLHEGTFLDENGEIRDIDDRLCEIAVDAVTEVVIGIIHNGYKFEGFNVEIGHSAILSEDRTICLLSADNVADSLFYGMFNGCWLYEAELSNRTKQFIEIF